MACPLSGGSDRAAAVCQVFGVIFNIWFWWFVGLPEVSFVAALVLPLTLVVLVKDFVASGRLAATVKE